MNNLYLEYSVNGSESNYKYSVSRVERHIFMPTVVILTMVDNPSSFGTWIIRIKGASIDFGMGSFSVFHDEVSRSVALFNKSSKYSFIISYNKQTSK
jgi:hypothetical protein